MNDSTALSQAASATLIGRAPMPRPYQFVRLCIWSGFAMLVLETLFWGILGQNIPPFPPSLDSQQFAEVLRAHAGLIRIGMTGATMCGILYMVWAVGLTKVMEPMERANSGNNMLSTLQIWGGGLTSVFFIVGPAVWLGAAYRAETMSPDVLQALYDVGWMLFDISAPTGCVQFVAFGLCVLADRRRVPLIPKWVGWMGIYVSAGLLMLALMPFFKTGAFARNGAISFWFEFPAFFLFMVFSTTFALKAVPRMEAEYAASNPPKA